jgi:hypothetical protein
MKVGSIMRAVGVHADRLRPLFLGLSALLLVATLAGPAETAPCTAGVDCYCDQAKSGDPSLLLCEDFEAPSLISSTGVGAGAPYYGPWFDDSGQPGGRGRNSYWTRTYGNGVNSALWSNGQPSSPTFGRSCAFSLCKNGAWDATNRWQANPFAFLAIMQDSDFSVEVPSVTRPGGKAGGGTGAFDGKASLAHRIPAGHTVGIFGTKAFPAPVRTFGVTMAVAYPTNLVASGINNAPWKHNEWNTVGGGAGGDGIFLFQNSASFSSQFPFENWMNFNSAGASQAWCQNSLNAATRRAGQFTCTSVGFLFRADPSVYNRATDWPLGTWGCVRAHYQNMGLANGSIQMWFMGVSGVEKKIIDISNMNMTLMNSKNGYSGFTWNNYANVNQAGSGKPRTTQTTFRYEDNLHIRAGAPVSCAQIGFNGGASADSVPPANPSGVNLR